MYEFSSYFFFFFFADKVTLAPEFQTVGSCSKLEFIMPRGRAAYSGRTVDSVRLDWKGL